MDILLRKVVRDLLRRRVRTALTLLGIVVGVAGLVAVSATARQLGAAQAAMTAAPGQPDLSVRTVEVPDRTLRLVGRQLGTIAAEPRTEVEASFSGGGPWRGSLVIGRSPGSAEVGTLRQPELIEGRTPGPGEVAFDVGVAALAEVAIGDLVAFRSDGGARPVYLELVGLTRTPAALDAAILNRVNAYAVPAEVERIAGRAGSNRLLVRLPPGVERGEAAVRLGRLLDRRGIGHGPVVRAEAGPVGERELRTVVWLLLAFSVLGLVLSAFLVANTVAATVHDEFEQIGVLKALGATRLRVVGAYVAPAMLLGVVATLVGYGVGLVGGQAIVALLTRLLGYPTPPVAVTIREAALATTVGVLVPVAASLSPALLGSRVPVVRLLRAYGLASPSRRRGLAAATLALGGRWPLLTLGASNALRRRLRGGITVALIAVAVGAAVAAQALSSSLESTVDTLYDRYAADVWIALDGTVDAGLAARIGRDLGVVEAEAWGRESGYVGGRSIDLWALPRQTSIYRYRLVDGAWLGAEGREAVASTNLARRLDLRPGDPLVVDVGSERRVIDIVGIVDDESTYLGSTAAGKLFLTPATLAGFAPESAFAFLAVRFDRHDPSGVEEAIAAFERRHADLHPRSYAAYADKASTARTVDVLTFLLRAMVILVATIGLIGVVNTLAMGVAERRREIGVARALGARRHDLASLLVVEGLALGGAGYGGGLLLGYPLGRLLVRSTGEVLFRLSFDLPISFLALGLVVTLACCAAAGLGPAVVAAGVRPTAVLRYE